MQDKVSHFNKNRGCHSKPMTIPARLLDIESELGELGKEYLKHSKYDTDTFVMTDNFKLEYGDTLYALLSLADEVGISSSECLDMALDKYRKRIEQNNSMGSKKGE